MKPHILILAAGSSSRMRGGDKLLEVVNRQPLLARTAGVAFATGLPVAVALAPDRPLRHAALAGMAITRVSVPDASEGMAASLRAGLRALPLDADIMLLLADLPEVETSDLALMIEEWAKTPDLILRGMAADGMPGHPVCFPAWARAGLEALQGDQGAKALLDLHKASVRYIALPETHATTDLDTPEAWAAWRSLRGQ